MVDAVVTRLLASVHMWISACVPLMSFHRPRNTWQVPKHFIGAYNSETVVLRVVRLILVDSKNIKEPRVSIPPHSLISYEDSHSTLRGLVAVIPKGSIRNAKDPRRTLNRPRTRLNFIIANLSAKLTKLLAMANSRSEADSRPMPAWKNCSKPEIECGAATS